MGKNVFAYIFSCLNGDNGMDSINLVPYIEDERLYEYAAACARTLRPEGMDDGRGEAQTLRRCFQEAERCHTLLQRRYEGASHIPAACEWLLDNFYLLQREYPAVRRALREAERQRCTRGRLLITALCRALLQAGHGRLTRERCASYLAGFQSVTILQRNELHLFPAALRAALLEAVASSCRKLGASSEPETLTEELAALFASLTLLAVMDMDTLLDEADIPGQILAEDPAGCYSKMDRMTKEDYLRRLSELADEQGLDEQTFARRIVDEAERTGRHVGFLLFSPPGEMRAAVYIASLAGLTLFGCLAAY
jgi:hypothetical protein